MPDATCLYLSSVQRNETRGLPQNTGFYGFSSFGHSRASRCQCEGGKEHTKTAKEEVEAPEKEAVVYFFLLNLKFLSTIRALATALG